MMFRKIGFYFVGILMMTALMVPPNTYAHCDTMDGPVVQDAQKALERSDVTPVLKWITAEQEEEVKAAFDEALTVRKLSVEAQALADRYFFETLVRLHRASEGAPYTGLKPAGQEESPIITLADDSLKSKSADEVTHLLVDMIRQGVQKRFEEALHDLAHAEQSVEQGRTYVAAYVNYMHYIENLYQNALAHSHAHENDSDAAQHREQHKHDSGSLNKILQK
ncbi:MAG: DUF6448 family protein [bacterium]